MTTNTTMKREDRIEYEGKNWVVSEVKGNQLLIKTLNLSQHQVKLIAV